MKQNKRIITSIYSK